MLTQRNKDMQDRELRVLRIYQKICGLIVRGVSDEAVSRAFGLEVGQLRALRDEVEFSRVLKEAYSRYHEERAAADEGWDRVERKAVKKLGDLVDIETNPNTLLRAAAIANKAVRRVDSNSSDPDERARVVNVDQRRVTINVSGYFGNKVALGGKEDVGGVGGVNGVDNNVLDLTANKEENIAPIKIIEDASREMAGSQEYQEMQQATEGIGLDEILLGDEDEYK